jgi:hypothetical protein
MMLKELLIIVHVTYHRNRWQDSAQIFYLNMAVMWDFQ